MDFNDFFLETVYSENYTEGQTSTMNALTWISVRLGGAEWVQMGLFAKGNVKCISVKRGWDYLMVNGLGNFPSGHLFSNWCFFPRNIICGWNLPVTWKGCLNRWPGLIHLQKPIQCSNYKRSHLWYSEWFEPLAGRRLKSEQLNYTIIFIFIHTIVVRLVVLSIISLSTNGEFA